MPDEPTPTIPPQNLPAKLILFILLTPLFVAGLIFFILWIGLHPHRPSFHIMSFSVPGLGQPNGHEKANITFNVAVRNSNRRTWIHYKSIDSAVYYNDQQVGSIPLLSSLDQPPKNTTILQQVSAGILTMSLASNNQSSMEKNTENNSTQETVMFSLRLASVIRFRKSIWDRRQHRVHADCDVGVGPDGFILPNYVGNRCLFI